MVMEKPTWTEIKDAARNLTGFRCRICRECNGIACRGETPGVGGKGSGLSFIRNYQAWQNIRLRMHPLYEKNASFSTDLIFLGHRYQMPIFAAPIGALTMNYGVELSDREYGEALVTGCQNVGSLAFTGDGIRDSFYLDPLEAIASHGGEGAPTTKPWGRKKLEQRMQAAQAAGARAIAMDIDGIGLSVIQRSGKDAGPKGRTELQKIIQNAPLPFIIKGVLTPEDAETCVEAGASAIVVSNHGGRVLDLSPSTEECLEEICDSVAGRIPVLVDGGIRSGVHVFAALALGATAVLIGRPLPLAIYGGRELGDPSAAVSTYLSMIQEELLATMHMTGCFRLEDIRKNGRKLLTC